MVSKTHQYQHGCIVKLWVKNFMHYTEQVIKPLPGFNVIIGHNGSGKSAIINAICIGLGGDIDTLQRCENISTFVRRGAKEAKITLELYNKEGDNWMVTSIITERGKSSWELNGEKTTKSQIENLVDSLNIQTNNMCQFLPQDVVKNFPLMSPQERFLSTVRAVGEGRLVDQFGRLKEIQQVINNNDGLIITKQSTLDNLKSKINAIEAKKQKLDEIDKLVSHKLISQKKLKWAVFESDIANAKKIKKQCDEIKAELKTSEDALIKCKEVDKLKDDEVKKLQEEMKVPESYIQETERIMMQPEISSKFEEFAHLEQLIASEEEEKSDRLKSLESAKAEVDKITRELKHCVSDSVVDAEIAKLKEKENQINNKIQTLSASKSDLVYKNKTLKESLKLAQKKLFDLRSAETQKLAQLKKANPDCYGAVMHIRNNMKEWRQSGRFKHGVYEPAVLSLSVPNLDHSVFIEKETGGQQLEAFVCEDEREANDLMQELRQHFQRVSVIHGDLSKMPQFEGPKGDRFLNRPRMEDMEKMNFVGFVGDMFSGPDAVRTHLFMHTSVYSTAVFSQETQYTDRISELFPNLRKYYVGKVLNTVRVSKYSKLATRGEEDISWFKPKRLKISFDQEEIDKLDKQIKEFSSEMQTCDKHILKINDTEAKNRQELSQIKRDIAENNQAKTNKNKLEISLKHKKELVEELSKPNNEAVHSEKMNNYKSDKKLLTFELVKQLQSLQENLAKERRLQKLKQNHLLEKFSNNSSQLAKREAEVSDFKKRLKPLEKNLEAAKNKLRESKDEAHNSTADESKDVSKKPPPNYAAEFEKVDAKTVEELEAHVEALSKEIKAENKLIQEQIKINKIYKEKKDSIDKLEEELQKLTSEKVEAVKESKSISTGGVKKLQDLIDRVNDKFSSYFADLGYAGQVCLSRKDPTDFKSYGVSIKVKFRDGADWSELSRGRQSGGEMSVTTAVYMLALQEMTTVPFRCVDEINQGLDERNERRVWDMILAAATTDQGSQYFYLAPKMPYNLNYKPGTVVHLCHASDVIKRPISSVDESETSRWVSAAKKLKCDS